MGGAWGWLLVLLIICAVGAASWPVMLVFIVIIIASTLSSGRPNKSAADIEEEYLRLRAKRNVEEILRNRKKGR